MVDTRRLEEYIEEYRQERIAKGLPLKGPDKFVSVPLSAVLAERIRPLERVAVKFLKLLGDGVFHRIDAERLEKFRVEAELLCYSKSLHGFFVGFGAGGIISLIDQVRKAIDENNTELLNITHMLGNGYLFLKWLRETNIRCAYGDHCRDDEDDLDRLYGGFESANDQFTAFFGEVKRLRDDSEALEKELASAKAHYESIKHLI